MRGGSSISRRAAKGFYLAIIFISAIAALVLLNYGGKIAWPSVVQSVCQPQGALSSQCAGASAVLRISLALASFFALNLLFTFSADSFVGCWGIKVLLWLGLVVGSFYVPAADIERYTQASRGFSVIFLLFSIILIIDFCYHAQETLQAKIYGKQRQLEETMAEVGCCQNTWSLLYLAIVATAVLASFSGIVLLYKFSTRLGEDHVCNENSAFLSVTLISGVIFLAVSPLACTGSKGLLTPALVLAYSTWLCWSAIYSNPDALCNPVPPDTTNTAATIVGMVIAALSLVYTAFSASRSFPSLFDVSKGKSTLAAAAQHDAEDCDHPSHDEEAASQALTSNANSFMKGLPKAGSSGAAAPSTALVAHTDADGNELGSAASYARGAAAPQQSGTVHEPVQHHKLDAVLFVVILTAAALYMGQILTNWVDSIDSMQAQTNTAMYVQIATQWITIALYSWTLVAERCCPNRDFS